MRSNRLSQSPEKPGSAHATPSGIDRSYPQARPAGNDGLGDRSRPRRPASRGWSLRRRSGHHAGRRPAHRRAGAAARCWRPLRRPARSLVPSARHRARHPPGRVRRAGSGERRIGRPWLGPRIGGPSQRARTCLGADHSLPSVRMRRGRPVHACAVAPRRGPARPGRWSRPPRSATSKSSVMPIDSSRPSPGQRSRSRADRSRSSRNVPRAASASTASRPTVIRPSNSRCSRARRAGSAPSTSAGAKPALAGSRSTLTWTQDRVAGAGADFRDEAVEPLGELHRVDRLDRVERLERSPRLVGLERTNELPRRARHLGRLGRSPPGRGSRRAS